MKPRDGDFVRATVLIPDLDERVLPPPKPGTRTIQGFVTVMDSPLTGEPRYSVNGITIDPDSAEELPVPLEL